MAVALMHKRVDRSDDKSLFQCKYAIGDLIDVSINYKWNDFQHKKYHPPCKVDIKLILSPAYKTVSSFSASYQSTSLMSTKMPGFLSYYLS